MAVWVWLCARAELGRERCSLCFLAAQRSRCSRNLRVTTPDLSDPVDVYAEWVDKAEEEQYRDSGDEDEVKVTLS